MNIHHRSGMAMLIDVGGDAGAEAVRATPGEVSLCAIQSDASHSSSTSSSSYHTSHSSSASSSSDDKQSTKKECQHIAEKAQCKKSSGCRWNKSHKSCGNAEVAKFSEVSQSMPASAKEQPNNSGHILAAVSAWAIVPTFMWWWFLQL